MFILVINEKTPYNRGITGNPVHFVSRLKSNANVEVLKETSNTATKTLKSELLF